MSDIHKVRRKWTLGWWRGQYHIEVVELDKASIEIGDVLAIPRKKGDIAPSGWTEAGNYFMRVADGTEPDVLAISVID